MSEKNQTKPNKKASSPQVKYPASYQLSADELELQHFRGAYYKKLMLESVDMFLEGKDREKIGIFLSGGVDSTTVLWALLQRGVRPYCYTFHLPTTPHLSQDAKKAESLASHYNLPFRVVTLTSDQNELATTIKQISDDNPGTTTRPDFEVATIFHAMLKEARDRDGVLSVFSGIADGAIHLLGREMEIRGRTGRMGMTETNLRRMYSVDGFQTIVLNDIAVKLGMNLCLPLLLVACCQPYYGVPWYVMNVPRLKQITIGQWEVQEKASKVRAMVSPLQNGDTGGRKYFDQMISNSKVAMDVTGKRVSSAIVYYNFLRSRFGRVEPAEKKMWDWVGYVADGIPLPADFGKPYTDPETGRARVPTVIQDDMTNLFGDITPSAEKFFLDEDGKPDTRVDIFGVPFYHKLDDGSPAAMIDCKRAQAGELGRPDPEHPYVVHKCVIWNEWNQYNLDFLEELAENSLKPNKRPYQQGIERAKTILSAIADERHSFS